MILLLLDTLLAVALLLAWGMATWRVSRLGVRDDGTRFRRTARTGMIFLTLGVALGVARLITTGLLWFTSGWWFAADRVLLALPLLLVPIIAALVLSGPRLRRLARIAPESPLGGALREAAISPALVVPLRVAALAAAIGAYCALLAPPPAPYWRATAVFAGLLALVAAVSWSLLQRRCLQRRLPARREPRKRPIFVRALGTVLVAFALIATWGGGSALASRLPDRYSMTGRETDDWGGGSPARWARSRPGCAECDDPDRPHGAGDAQLRRGRGRLDVRWSGSRSRTAGAARRSLRGDVGQREFYEVGSATSNHPE